jgi:hypothetical protein
MPRTLNPRTAFEVSQQFVEARTVVSQITPIGYAKSVAMTLVFHGVPEGHRNETLIA